MPPITWRNVDIGSNAAANQLMGQGIQTLNRGLEDIGGVVAKRDALNITNWDATAKLNTDQASALLDSAKTSAEVDALTAEGATLNAKTLTEKFGAQVDSATLLKSAAGRRTDLFKSETLDARNRTSDKLAAEKHASDLDTAKLTREATKASISRLNAEAQMVNQEYRIREDKRKLNLQVEDALVNIVKNTPDKDAAAQEAQTYLNNLVDSTNGLFTMADSQGALTRLTNITPRTDEATLKVLKLQSDEVTKANEEIQRGVGQLTDAYAISKGVDKSDIPLLSDARDEGTVISALTKRVADPYNKKYKAEGKVYDEAKTWVAYESVLKALEAKVGPGIQVTAPMVEKAMTVGGFDDAMLGGDGTYVVNMDIVDRYAEKITKAKDFVTNGADKIREFQQLGLKLTKTINDDFDASKRSIDSKTWGEAFNERNSERGIAVSQTSVKAPNTETFIKDARKMLMEELVKIRNPGEKAADLEAKLKTPGKVNGVTPNRFGAGRVTSQP